MNSSNCKKHRTHKKMKPYGMTRGKYWCHGCDAELIPDYSYKPRKKTARQKNSKLIRKEIKDYSK